MCLWSCVFGTSARTRTRTDWILLVEKHLAKIAKLRTPFFGRYGQFLSFFWGGGNSMVHRDNKFFLGKPVCCAQAGEFNSRERVCCCVCLHWWQGTRDTWEIYFFLFYGFFWYWCCYPHMLRDSVSLKNCFFFKTREKAEFSFLCIKKKKIILKNSNFLCLA